jgi:hypothetical protein
MPQRPGAHAAYARRGELVVEWYDFGEDAPYESANLIVFDAAAQRELAGRLGADPAIGADELAALVASRFGSYFEARQFAADHAIAFRAEVDFTP